MWCSIHPFRRKLFYRRTRVLVAAFPGGAPGRAVARAPLPLNSSLIVRERPRSASTSTHACGSPVAPAARPLRVLRSPRASLIGRARARLYTSLSFPFRPRARRANMASVQYSIVQYVYGYCTVDYILLEPAERLCCACVRVFCLRPSRAEPSRAERALVCKTASLPLAREMKRFKPPPPPAPRRAASRPRPAVADSAREITAANGEHPEILSLSLSSLLPTAQRPGPIQPVVALA